MKIIPAIDIIDGKCVRLTQGDYQQKKNYGNPLDIALQFSDAGLNYLHLVDLDGAKSRHIVNHAVLKKIATKTSLHIDFSGGISNDENLQLAFDCGAHQVTLGSIAVQNFDKSASWIYQFGADKFIIGADVLHEKIQIQGWTVASEISLFDFITQYIKVGVQNFMCTDIEKDGTLQGASFSLYKKIKTQFPNIQLTASGGINSVQNILECAASCDSIIVGRALYENKISIQELVSLQNII